jgi:hypothetical protein
MLTIVGLSVTLSSAAQASTITFESTDAGFKSQGFAASGEPGISFFSNSGSSFSLQVANFGPQSLGNGLGVFGENGDFLKGVMSTLTSSLTLTFGNDDTCCTSPGDLAVLKTFLGTTLVGTTTVVMNRNDLADQTITSTGAAFDNFTFAYTNAGGTPIELIEIVDNINFTAAVPEPSTWAMLLLGFAGVGLMTYRRLSSTAAFRLA